MEEINILYIEKNLNFISIVNKENSFNIRKILLWFHLLSISCFIFTIRDLFYARMVKVIDLRVL